MVALAACTSNAMVAAPTVGPTAAIAIATSPTAPAAGVDSLAKATEGQEVGTASQERATAAVVRALDEFWGVALPELYGRPYSPPKAWGAYSLANRGSLPSCGDRAVSASVAVDNAFYCKPDDAVRWDTALMTRLWNDAGEFGAALVLAHEWAHVAQARAGVNAGVVRELQADCFAGAWLREVLRGQSNVGSARRDELDQAIVAYLGVRDDADTVTSGLHGSTFDRVIAFAEGNEEGGQRCAAYPSEPPNVAPLTLPWADVTGGQRPLEELLAFVPADLDRYWRDVSDMLPGDPLAELVAGIIDSAQMCPGLKVPSPSMVGARWCQADRLLRVDVVRLGAVWADQGDFAAAALLARGWAEAAATVLLSTDDPPVAVADCLVGAWAGASLRTQGGERGPMQTRLSVGDLDEGLLGLLGNPWPGPGATVFDRSVAFGAGLHGGLSVCVERTYVR